MNSGDFVEARRRLEAKARVVGDKRTSLGDAARHIKDGDHIAIGGCLYSRTPLALLMEVLRQDRRGLTLSRNLMCYEGEWFIAAGATKNIVASWFGIGLPWGLSRVLREMVEGGQVRFEEWSHLALGLRYRAGAMGVPFLPTLTMLGSDLMGVGNAKTMLCPFTGETLCLVPALFPDVAVLHVHRADRLGNCQIDGYPHMDADMALAATTVLVTAERIVSEDEIRSQPDRTTIPGFAVDAVVEVPYGAFPHECYGIYDADFNHFDEYVSQGSAVGVAGVRDYLDRYVYGTATHEDYLALFSTETLERVARSAKELTGGAMSYSASELLAVMASRQLVGVNSVFAGVGIALLSAGLAQKTHAPDLTIVVEGGSIGPELLPGQLPISTNEMRIAHRARMLPGITDTFLFAQRGLLEVGFVGGAQVDRYGNLNSTVVGAYAKPKVRLPGSGGANDIISLCHRVIVVTMHERRRFVPRVDFVTSPGFLDGGGSRLAAGLLFGRVSQIVTDLAILGFDQGTKAMRLESLQPGVSVQDVVEKTGFELLVPDGVPVTEPPRQEELDVLRSLDPDRRYL